jgi:hypothetical protein
MYLYRRELKRAVAVEADPVIAAVTATVVHVIVKLQPMASTAVPTACNIAASLSGGKGLSRGCVGSWSSHWSRVQVRCKRKCHCWGR